MLQEAIQELFQRADATSDAKAAVAAIELGGLPYVHHGEKLTPLKTPDYPTLTVNTLAGLVDAFRLVEGAMCVAVQGPTAVVLYTKPLGAWLERRVLVRAIFDASEVVFPYTKWMEADEFVIALQTRFGAGGDRDKIARIVGNLSGGVVRTSTDDGLSQQVSVRAGVSLLGEEKIVNPIMLQPYRTFPDVEQPISPFIVRLKQEKDCTPKAALFEADGGLWKRAAMDALHTFLVAANLGVPVLR